METRQATTLSSTIESRSFSWLDRIAEPVQSATHSIFRSSPAMMKVKSLLNGTPIRHRLHPVLTDLPIGFWTTSACLDVLSGVSSAQQRAGYQRSADAAMALGIASSLPTAISGLADWTDTYDHPRRVGMAHALFNVTALACYSASLALRATNRRGAATALSTLGFTALSMGGSLGGELVYTLGVNVPYILYPKPPEGFTDVLAAGDLKDGQPVVVEVDRLPVLMVRRGGTVYAVQDWCPHAGGPLSEGTFDGNVVECPWHQSRFCLRDGKAIQGPAAIPLRTFEVREERGRISIKPSFEGQSWPPPPKPLRDQPEVIVIEERAGRDETVTNA